MLQALKPSAYSTAIIMKVGLLKTLLTVNPHMNARKGGHQEVISYKSWSQMQF